MSDQRTLLTTFCVNSQGTGQHSITLRLLPYLFTPTLTPQADS